MTNSNIESTLLDVLDRMPLLYFKKREGSVDMPTLHNVELTRGYAYEITVDTGQTLQIEFISITKQGSLNSLRYYDLSKSGVSSIDTVYVSNVGSVRFLFSNRPEDFGIPC